MSSDCSVCCSTYNKVIKKKVECCFCEFEACRHCIETYTKSKYDDFHCMSCKKPWDYDFFLNNMTKACVKRIMDHRSEVLLEREKAKMPDTQAFILYGRKIDGYRTKMRLMYQQFNNINETILDDNDLYDLISSVNTPEDIKKLEELTNNTYKLNQKKSKWLNKATTLRETIHAWDVNLSMGKKKNKEEGEADEEEELRVITKCVEPECKGFVMSNWECGICQKKYCQKCHTVTPEGEGEVKHVCNPDDVKTIKLIMNTTKPCPTCATLIHKINGCNQMWCPSCKTAFNYSTGNIERGIIHNPHYFEWFRNNQKNGIVKQTETNCNREIDQRQFLTHVNIAFKSNGVAHNHPIHTLHIYNRIYGHIEYVMEDIPNVDTTSVNYNLRNRMKWMLSDLTDDEFKKILLKEEKKVKYESSIKHIAHMSRTVFNDIFHKVLFCNSPAEVEPFLKELTTINKYANEQLEYVCKTYGQKIKTLGNL
jgi:hypothetical protein